MAFSVRVAQSIIEGATSISSTVDYTSEAVFKSQETIANGVTDEEYLVPIDVSALQVFGMKSDQALTVKTNSSGTPQETFNLVANRQIVWQSGDSSIFAGDVTSLFISNSSGSEATFEILVAMDN